MNLRYSTKEPTDTFRTLLVSCTYTRALVVRLKYHKVLRQNNIQLLKNQRTILGKVSGGQVSGICPRFVRRILYLIALFVVMVTDTCPDYLLAN
jgi:hypothetical protein